MKSNTIYLHFNGECRDAMDFYGNVFGAKPDYKTYGESGMANDKPERANAILHSTLMGEGISLMASDAFERAETEKSGFSISLDCSSLDEMEKTFGALSDGGNVILAIHDAFWGGKFGMTKDKFGIVWLFAFGA